MKENGNRINSNDCDAARTTQIATAMSGLDQAITLLNELIYTLIAKLESISLMQPPEEPTPKTIGMVDDVVPFAKGLYGMQHRLNHLQDMVRDQADRLEL